MGSDAVLSRFSASRRPVHHPCPVLSGDEGHQARVFVVGMCADVQHMPDHSQTADSVENFGEASWRAVRLSQTAGPMCDRHAYPPWNLRMAAPPSRRLAERRARSEYKRKATNWPRPLNHTIDLLRAVLETVL